jgi:hypothetical protein
MMKCSSCNSELKVIEYQARSADEAQRSIARCPNCPLNLDDFLKGRVNVHLHLKRRQRIIKTTPIIDSSSSKRLRFICGRTKTQNLTVDLSNTSPIYASNYVDNKGHMFRHHQNGKWNGTAISVISKTEIAPNVKLIDIDIVSCHQPSENPYRIFDQVTIDENEYIINGDYATLWLPVTDNISIPAKLYEMYLSGFAPMRLSDYIGQTVLQSLSNLTARAYDRYMVEDHEHRFGDKPDGQRMWITKIGMVYLFSCRLTGHIIKGWEVDLSYPQSFKTTIGPVIDVEFMLNSKPKLIDVLMDETSSITTHQRTMCDITFLLEGMKKVLPMLLRIETRQFFDTYEQASIHRQTLDYPTDGIVAITKSGTDMFKIKDERSMELEIMQDGKLSTSDGTTVFSSQYHEVYEPGTIIEIRFRVDDGLMDIKRVFHRPDKQRANDIDAVKNIIQSSTEPSDDTSNILRTEIWRWSNTLRSSMYSFVQRQVQDRGVVLDVGTGDGQSLDAFISMKDVSFIFVEPNEVSCKKLMSRLGVRKMYTDPRSVIPAVPQLRKGTVKYHILNCSITEVVNDDATMQNLKHIVNHVTSCFSAQFAVNDLASMAAMGMSVIGCCYLYDDIEPGSAIIDEHGLKMSRINTTQAQVKWGSDKIYDEPALETSDIPEMFVKIPAIDFVGPPSDTHNGLVRRVCSHAWILRSR